MRAQKGGPGGKLTEFGGGGGGGGGDGGALWQHARPVELVSKRGGSDAACNGAVGVRRVITARRSSAGGGLEVRLELTNLGQSPMTLSALGLAMAFDQNFVGRSLPQASRAIVSIPSLPQASAHFAHSPQPPVTATCYGYSLPLHSLRPLSPCRRWRTRLLSQSPSWAAEAATCR